MAESGVNVVISGGAVSEMALHFLERYKMLVVKVLSKFDLRRVCKAVGATPLVRLGAPTPEEAGHCDVVTVEELGSTKVLIFRQEKEDSEISTVVVRASTNNILDDIERAVGEYRWSIEVTSKMNLAERCVSLIDRFEQMMEFKSTREC